MQLLGDGVLRASAVVFALIVGSAISTGGASAAVIYQSISSLSANPGINAWCSDCGGGDSIVSEVFSLASAANVLNIRFDVETDYFFPTAVTIDIHEASGGSLGALLFSQVFAPADFVSVINTAFDTSIVSVNPTGGFALAAGDYDIAIYNPSDLGIPGYTGGPGQGYNSFGFRHLLPDIGPDIGVQLNDTIDVPAVPELATWGMMILGFGLVGVRLRQRGAVAG